MSEFLIKLDLVCKSYGGGASTVHALTDANLAVRAGEFLGIVGPSGSGKTTLLTMLGLVERPSRGSIILSDGSTITSKTTVRALRNVRRDRIGFVFQKPNLANFLTAEENVQLALDVRGKKIPREEARNLLTGLGLGNRLRSYPHQLSGGEQQRVSLARALVGRPSLILADEPTASLDEERGIQVLRLMRSLSAHQKVAVCIVTHDLRTLQYFDRIVRINDGLLSELDGEFRARE